jgi:hypothetical protein
MDLEVSSAFRWLLVSVALYLFNGLALAQCKGEPVLKVSYEGVGMVINGKHLYLSVCDSGEVEYDNGEFQTASRRKRARLTDKQRTELAALLNDAGTRNLTGKYSGLVGVRDHSEWLDVTISRPEGKQEFTALDFYGEIKKTYPPALVAFLCRIDKVRTKTDWHVSVALTCPAD